MPQVQKITPADDPEAYLNTFEWMAKAARWGKVTWPGVLMPCLIGSVQQAVDTVPLADLNNYDKIRTAILQMLNLIPELYR